MKRGRLCQTVALVRYYVTKLPIKDAVARTFASNTILLHKRTYAIPILYLLCIGLHPYFITLRYRTKINIHSIYTRMYRAIVLTHFAHFHRESSCSERFIFDFIRKYLINKYNKVQ